ncbi:MAG TPA: cellulase family glycosylhydrolase, partial [Tepidisphaeraceae bacterium]|nr:cellulase family glycosylhydrolase [Tepidisphaeraceae bacterium]
MTVSLGLLLMRLMTPAAWAGSSGAAASPASDNPAPPDAWVAVAQMTPGINIGNTLEATAGWETGWGNPPITKEYVQTLARLGFKTVRLPVAWDTYADNGRITQKQFDRVAEVV